MSNYYCVLRQNQGISITPPNSRPLHLILEEIESPNSLSLNLIYNGLSVSLPIKPDQQKFLQLTPDISINFSQIKIIHSSRGNTGSRQSRRIAEVYIQSPRGHIIQRTSYAKLEKLFN